MKVLLIVIDQLPGHWTPGVEVVPGFPPVNVWDYVRKGFVKNFRYLVENGLFAFAWNMGICDTAHGMKYLATGRYNAEPYWTSVNGWPYYPRKKGGEGPIGLFEFAQHYAPTRIKPACFTTDHWIAPGYFYTAGYPIALSAYHPDEKTWREYAKPYLEKKKDWNLVYIYFPVMDAISYCPSYAEKTANPKETKHSYMLYLDTLIDEVIEFLKSSNVWDETYLILASDHGYHAACTVAKKKGAETPNKCMDHPPPYDCNVWDFQNNRDTGQYSGGPRRTTFIVSGGALEEKFRGKIVEYAEIIDVAPTIAEILDIPYECEGTSLFKKKMLNLDYSREAPVKPLRKSSDFT